MSSMLNIETFYTVGPNDIEFEQALWKKGWDEAFDVWE